MKNNIYILFFCLIAFIKLYSQVIVSGKIINDRTNAVIPYASIGIRNTEKGGIADENGVFHLSFSENDQNLEVVISAIGFEDKTIKVSDFNTLFQIIKLNPTEYLLDEVIIKTKSELRNKVVGKTKRPFVTFSQMFTDENPAVEQGTIFKIPNYAILKNYNFHIIPSSRFKEIKMKLNIYGIKNQQPDKQLLIQNVIFNVTNTGWFYLDLEPYKIKIKGYKEIAVTCQLLDIQKLDGVPFSFGISAYFSDKKWILTRNRSQSDWLSKSGVLVANCEIDYKKEKSIDDKKSIVNDGNETYLTLKEKDLVEVYKHKIEAKRSGFGDNEKAGNTIIAKGSRLYYETYGSGEPLVLLHGNGGEIADFYKQIPLLSTKYKVIGIDTRGQGKSTDFLKGNLTYETFAEDVKVVLDSLHLKKANIVGWSDGGNTGLILSYKYPEYVNKLVAIGAVLNPNGVDDKLMESLKERLKDSESGNDEAFQNARLVRLLIEQPNIQIPDLKNISAPTLVIVGERDCVKLEHTKLIAESIPNCELKIIKNASHYVVQEKPYVVNNMILEFLKSVN